MSKQILFTFIAVVLVASTALAKPAPVPAPQAKSAPAPQAKSAPAPQAADDTHAETLRLETENNGIDKYSFAYDTSNGISRSEQGELKETEEGSAIVSSGTVAWIAPDGKKYEFTFTADEHGYHPIIKYAA